MLPKNLRASQRCLRVCHWGLNAYKKGLRARYRDLNTYNKTPKGIMRSAVPLPCFFDVVKSQRVAGQRPRQGTKSRRRGRNSFCPPVRPSVCPPLLAGPQTLLAGPQTLRAS